MKHILSYILALGLLTAGPVTTVSAQDYTPVPVTVSKDKVRVDGKLYYSHIVLERQTVYSICKAYNVTEEQIYAINPTVRTEGLKKNAVILIPCPEKEAVQARDTEQAPKKRAERKTEKKQTVHTVKWYEDLDTIAEKYGVSVEAIMKANGLTGRKLTKRQKLIIPDSTAPSGDAMPMLPFDSNGEKPRNGSIDFYCGTLMAVKQIGDSGTDIDLSVYDVAGGVLPITVDRLRASDVVIGPVSAGDLSALLAKCPSEPCVISPLDHRAEYLSGQYSNFVQVPTSTLTQYEDLAEWIREERKSGEEKVIVVYEKGARNIEELGAMNSILEKDGIPFSTFSYSILEGRDIQEPLMGMMNAEAPNRVVVMSESEAFVNDVVRNLNLLIHAEYDIILYAPSKIRSFETIEVDNLHNTHLHTSLAYYVDYEDAAVKDFIKRYRALYNTEPTPYAFQGYDIACYFLKMCAASGESPERWENLTVNRQTMLQSDFRFERNGTGGYVNTGVRRIIYGPGYSITETSHLQQQPQSVPSR